MLIRNFGNEIKKKGKNELNQIKNAEINCNGKVWFLIIIFEEFRGKILWKMYYS